MRNVILSVAITASMFMASALYLQADGHLVISTGKLVTEQSDYLTQLAQR